MTNDVEKLREIIQSSYNKEEHKTTDKTDIELYSWVKEIKSKQEFQVMEIVDKNTFICFNANHSDGIELKRTEIDILK